MAKVCVSCQGNGEGFGGLEEVPSVLWVQFEECESVDDVVDVVGERKVLWFGFWVDYG